MILTKEERDKLWEEYERNDPYQTTPWDEFMLKAQLKKFMGMLKACDGELVSRSNKPFMVTFEMPAEDYLACLKEIE